MPHLQGVPERDAIEIHAGNTMEDTEGCILVGTIALPSGIYNSRRAFEEFFGWLSVALKYGPVFCEITSDEGWQA